MRRTTRRPAEPANDPGTSMCRAPAALMCAALETAIERLEAQMTWLAGQISSMRDPGKRSG